MLDEFERNAEIEDKIQINQQVSGDILCMYHVSLCVCIKYIFTLYINVYLHIYKIHLYISIMPITTVSEQIQRVQLRNYKTLRIELLSMPRLFKQL